MPTKLLEKGTASGARGPGAGGRNRFGRGEGAVPSGQAPAARAHTAVMGLAFALAAIAMLFVAFTMTYLGHRQEGDWKPVPLPGILWLDTAILLASSAAVEWARRRLGSGDPRGLRWGLTAAGTLGVAFLAGQLLAWRQLADQGVYLASHPHSSFFYLLTGTHGVHLLGGLIALGAILPGAWRGAYSPARSTAVTLVAIYWHFLTGLWLYVFAILLWQ
ncbi:MAG: hypothetical protein E6H02_11525 [Bacillati bacterium ANGP1]|uniref:Heme-copper oxidase subunit III family profile domain-containing protein n=1 Tax=Candidatus Segetimicrobium genomatis TaxID=2569760 RepID=A0A537LI91_9BACT|nr:MAG: hypothetical protein E6H02_11525 [Terrabacteria group bacterium ANGP1]